MSELEQLKIKISDILKDHLGEDWYNLLSQEFEKDYMRSLTTFISLRRKEGIVYPPKGDVFNAYKLTPYDEVKVCIVGQDPYINPFEAHGLAFSTWNNQGTPSLKQIEAAVRKDMGYDSEYKWKNNLERWSKQGIMLLNSVLTVDAGKSNSHAGMGWEQFTLQTIRKLDEKGIIFLLWGSNAKAYKNQIKNSIIMEAEHPQYANYQGRAWLHGECFKKVNELLGDDKIIW